MRAPLGQFAERMKRNNEISEFIRGLIREFGVSPDLIATIAEEEQKRLQEKVRYFIHQGSGQ